jgi:hypothetical protein
MAGSVRPASESFDTDHVMRLADLQLRLRMCKDQGDLKAHFHRKDGSVNSYQIIGVNELRSKLHERLSLPVVGRSIEKLLFSEPLRIAADEIHLNFSQFNDLQVVAVKADQKIDTLLEFLEFRLSEQEVEESQVSIKLGKGNQFSTVTEKLNSLEKILSQAMSVMDDSNTVQVKGWENGSLWIDLIVGSSSALLLIGGLSWSAACAYKKYQEGRILSTMCEAQAIKNDVLSAIQESTSNGIKAIIEAEAKRLDLKHSKKSGDHETIARLTHCIRELFEMMKEGTEIHPSLTAPENVKNVFPKLNEVLGLPSITKLLEDGSSDQSEADNSPD